MYVYRRYYAGNWPVTMWLWRKDASDKLQRLSEGGRTLSPMPQAQMTLLWPVSIAANLMYRVMAFRAMHLHGRLMPRLLRTALRGKSFDEFRYADGELMAGVLLGYNFGDGFLHDGHLLRLVQEQAQFAPGDLVHMSILPSPTFGRKREMQWTVTDASDPDHPIASGRAAVSDLTEMQPF